MHQTLEFILLHHKKKWAFLFTSALFFSLVLMGRDALKEVSLFFCASIFKFAYEWSASWGCRHVCPAGAAESFA
jgi:polyferredoxin